MMYTSFKDLDKYTDDELKADYKIKPVVEFKDMSYREVKAMKFYPWGVSNEIAIKCKN